MVSITHTDVQIVESKEITPISSPENTYDSNNDELNDSEDEEEVNVCDTCGVLGFINMLAICDNCGIGAEHTYCMAVRLKNVPERWFCYDCVEDNGFIKQNSKPCTDLFEVGESSGFQKQNDSGNQKSFVTVGLDLNIEHNLNLNPNIDLNVDPPIDLNVNHNQDLNLDMNLDPNPDLKMDINLDLSLDCGSSYRSSSTSNCQAHKRKRTSQNPLLEQKSLEEDEEEEEDAKRHRVNTRLSL